MDKEKKKIFESEYRFCEILWEREPIGSGELAKLCEEQLGWKKSTTYTVIKRLTERKIIENVNSIVRALVTKDEALEWECKELMKKHFSGSLPQFLTAFARRQKLSKEDILALQKLIDDYKG